LANKIKEVKDLDDWLKSSKKNVDLEKIINVSNSQKLALAEK